MKSALCFALCSAAIFITSATADAQAVNPARLKFRGIGLGSTYGQVVKALGKPSDEGRATDEACLGGQEKTVEYDGITFNFMNGDSRGGKTFEVKSFEVRSAKYVVSGLKVGDSAAVVRKAIGRKFVTERDPATGDTIWRYDMGERNGPGSTTINFRNGKVTSIGSHYMVC